MPKKIVIITILVVGLMTVYSFAQAANPFNFKFPVAELGNCSSMEVCRAYCDVPAHADACLNFAQKQGLVSKAQVDTGIKFQTLLQTGDVPVEGCTDESSCKQLCGLPEHRSACMAWAERHGFDTSHAQEASQPGESNTQSSHKGGIDKQKALEAIQANGGPGGCTSFQQCSDFCSSPDNQKICFDYAKKYNLISDFEAAKIQTLVTKPGPGGCIGEECQSYCADQSHHDVCTKFAVENGFMTQEQADQEAQQFNLHKEIQDRLKNSGGPGGCTNEDECRSFCSKPSHVEECNNFAKKAGFISPSQADRNIQDFHQQIDLRKMKDSVTEPDQPQSNSDNQDVNQPGNMNQDQRQDQPQPEQNHINDGSQNDHQPSVDDASMCTSHGGTWAGTFCELPGQPNPAEACGRSNGVWDGSVCIFPSNFPLPQPAPSGNPDMATQCKQAGGTWSGTSCVLPKTLPILGALIKFFFPFSFNR